MIKKLLCLCLCLLSLGCLASADAASMKKKTVAVPPVTIACDSRWDYEAAGMLHGELISALVNSGMYEVVERTQLDAVMDELHLQNSGAIAGSTAIEFGQLAGAEYTVCATLYEASVGDFDNYFYRGTKARVKLDFRFIDNKTGRILTDKMIEGTKTVSEFENMRENHRMIISRAVSDAADDILEELKGSNSGLVIKASDDIVYIDIGADMGVDVKDRYAVYRAGEVLVHPVTEEVLGMEEIVIAEIVITDVKPNYAVGELKKCEDIVQAGDQVKRIKKD